MIQVTRLNGDAYVLNADLIEMLESTPDTTITLTTGHKVNVQEPCREVVRRVVEFRRRLLGDSWMDIHSMDLPKEGE